jgi:hypothetical protein
MGPIVWRGDFAVMNDRVLRSIPDQLNLKTASSIPSTFLVSANEVIEQAAIYCTAYVASWHEAEVIGGVLDVRS